MQFANGMVAVDLNLYMQFMVFEKKACKLAVIKRISDKFFWPRQTDFALVRERGHQFLNAAAVLE